MRKLTSALLSVLLVVFLAGPVDGQFKDFSDSDLTTLFVAGSAKAPGLLDFNSIGGGARAAGMGGAFLALADGEMAFSWNPARMVFVEKASIGFQLVSAADEFTMPVATFIDTFQVASVASTVIERNHFDLDFGGFVAPFSFMERDWAVGGGYRTVYDMELEFESPGLFGSKNSFTQSQGIDAVSFAVANRLTEQVAIGITANSYIRGSEMNYWRGASGFLPDTVDMWLNDKSHYSGFNLDIGAAANFDMVGGAFVLHTPYDLKQETKLTASFMLPPEPVGLIDRVTSTSSIPLGFSLGLYVKPVERLTLAFDFESHPMSDVKIEVDWEQTIIPDTTIDPDWENLNQFRVGAEYILETEFADVPLRVGFRNNPSVEKELLSTVRTDTSSVDTFGDQINTSIFTFGTGLHFDRAWIDLAYQFGSNSYDTVWNFYGNEYSSEVKQDYSRLFISAGMYF